MNGPDLWNDILAEVHETFPGAVIAGGAVRDFLLGQEPRDIDVFVNATRDELSQVDLFGGELLTFEELSDYKQNPDWKEEVTGVLNGFYGGYPVQIIGRAFASGDELMERFDLGITRCWFDGQLHDTPAAAADRRARTLTLMRWDTPEHVRATKKRVKRFRERGSVWTFVDPRQ